MKASNVLSLSQETVKEAIKEYLMKSVFQEHIKFEIKEIAIERSNYGEPEFKVTIVEIA